MSLTDNFCCARRRPRKVKSVQTPLWCPRRKSPCELRIYSLINAETKLKNLPFYVEYNVTLNPSPKDYAMAYEGHTTLSPWDFGRRLASDPGSIILDREVALCDVVEIDDGIEPVYFYKENDDYRVILDFDTAVARANEYKALEQPQENEEPWEIFRRALKGNYEEDNDLLDE